MNFEWEKEDEKLKRHIKISPKKKLEWLFQVNEFIEKFSPRKNLAIRRKLRKIKNLDV